MDSSSNDELKRIYANWDTLTDYFDLQNVIYINDDYLFAYNDNDKSYVLIEYKKSSNGRTIAKRILCTSTEPSIVMESEKSFVINFYANDLRIKGFEPIMENVKIDLIKNGESKGKANLIYRQIGEFISNLNFALQQNPSY
jgi:hypothetical protein